jgi:hypothetical protein
MCRLRGFSSTAHGAWDIPTVRSVVDGGLLFMPGGTCSRGGLTDAKTDNILSSKPGSAFYMDVGVRWRPREELMSPATAALEWSIGLFIGMVACFEVGYSFGVRSSERHPDLTHIGLGPIEAAVFALLGLLLGFSFAGGTTRLDARRQQIAQEANAIGAAYLRMDLLPAADQPAMRQLFRKYLDARLLVYDRLPDLKAVESELPVTRQLQQEIWSNAVAASRGDGAQDTARLLLPALNEMFEVSTVRTVTMYARLPNLIFALLVLVALLSSSLAGYGMAERKKRSWFHVLLFAGAVAVTVYAVLDLDDSRVGLIRLDSAENVLVQLRDSIR